MVDLGVSSHSACSSSSTNAGEPLWGTANDAVQRWLLVEHYGRWGAKVPRDTEGLSEALRSVLAGAEGRLAQGTRVQLIRRPLAGGRGPLRVFLVEPGREGPRMMTREVPDVEALLEEDWAATGVEQSWEAAARGDGPWRVCARPLVLVCTNGARDACCARHGVGLYLALEQARDRAVLAGGDGSATPPLPEVWQTSHLGGHRFAAVALSLPDAHVYGRVQAKNAAALLAAVATGRLFSLAHVRGSSRRHPSAQVAELCVRRMLDERAFGAVEASSPQLTSSGATVRVTVGEARYEVRMREIMINNPLHQSFILVHSNDVPWVLC